MTYIYLLRGTNGYYKIGITQNIQIRLTTLNSDNPDSISVIRARIIANAPLLEQELHAKYTEFRTKNGSEWFKLTNDQVLDICTMIHKAEIVKEHPDIADLKVIISLLYKLQEEIFNLRETFFATKFVAYKDRKTVEIEKKQTSNRIVTT